MAKKALKHVIVGVHITDRIQHAAKVQQVFTKYGGHIKTRLGLNDLGAAKAGPSGLILLEMLGGEEIADEMMGKLTKIAGVDTKKITFEH